MVKIKLDVCNMKQYIAEVTKFESEILVHSDPYIVNGKSIMGLYDLDLSKPVLLEVKEAVAGEKDNLITKLKELNIVVE